MASRKTSSGDFAMDALRAEQKMWEKQSQELESPAKSVNLDSKDFHALWIASVQYGFGHMNGNQQFRDDNSNLCDSLRTIVQKPNICEEKAKDFEVARLYLLHSFEDLEIESVEALKRKKLAEKARSRQQKKNQARIHELGNKLRLFKGR